MLSTLLLENSSQVISLGSNGDWILLYSWRCRNGFYSAAQVPHDGHPSSDTIPYWSSERSSYQVTPRLNQSSTAENLSVSETSTKCVCVGIDDHHGDGNIFEFHKKEQNPTLPQPHGWLICLDPHGSVWVPWWWWWLESGPAAHVSRLAETPWGPEASGQQVS